MKVNVLLFIASTTASTLIAPSTLHADQGTGGPSLTDAWWAAASDAAVFGDNLPEFSQEPTLLAQAQQEGGEEAPQSEECLKFAADTNADVGDILRAGCQPTLEQMAALMDNPLGNVAMLFTQFDLYKLENPINGREANYGVYTGIAQFPKKLNDNWNLINRVVWTVPSLPLDQDKIDDFDNRVGSQQGAFLPPSNLPAPLDLFDGRTTDFGDLYYVGLFAPAKPKDVLNGKLVWGLGFDLAFE